MNFYDFLQKNNSPAIEEWEIENFESLSKEDLHILQQDLRDKRSSPFFILFLAIVSILIATMIYLSF